MESPDAFDAGRAGFVGLKIFHQGQSVQGHLAYEADFVLREAVVHLLLEGDQGVFGDVFLGLVPCFAGIFGQFDPAGTCSEQ